MKALVLEQPGRLSHQQSWPEPVAPEGWVLVEVRAAGICGSDLPRVMQTGAYRHPLIPGHEFSGVLQSSVPGAPPVGSAVAVLPIIPCGHCDGCRIGAFHCKSYDFLGSRRDGGFAEYCAVPPENLLPLPASLSFAEGAFVEPLSVALHVVRRSGLTPGARALVMGGGTIGLLVAQWASILGASRVVVADVREESLTVAQACGITETVDSRSEAFARLDEFDVVFEAAGANAAFLAGLGKLAPHGMLTVVGRDVRDTVIPLNAFEGFMRREARLCGCWGYDLTQDRLLLEQTLAGGRLRLAPMVTAAVSLEEGPQMIRAMWARERFFCKILLNP